MISNLLKAALMGWIHNRFPKAKLIFRVKLPEGFRETEEWGIDVKDGSAIITVDVSDKPTIIELKPLPVRKSK